MTRPMDDARRCRARSRAGQRCKKAAILGGFVCQTHGGGAEQVKRKAAERLADLIDPDRLLREMARLAYSDLRQCFDVTGNLLPPEAWPESLAPAIAAVKVLKKHLA